MVIPIFSFNLLLNITMIPILIILASVLSIVCVLLIFLLHNRVRNNRAIKLKLSNTIERHCNIEQTFKNREQALMEQLQTINKSIEAIESKCSEIITQNDCLNQQLKGKSIELKSMEHKMLKLQRESEGYDVAVFIDWLNRSSINTEQARLMVENAVNIEDELRLLKAKYGKLEHEKKLLDNYAQAISTQLQIILKK